MNSYATPMTRLRVLDDVTPADADRGYQASLSLRPLAAGRLARPAGVVLTTAAMHWRGNMACRRSPMSRTPSAGSPTTNGCV